MGVKKFYKILTKLMSYHRFFARSFLVNIARLGDARNVATLRFDVIDSDGVETAPVGACPVTNILSEFWKIRLLSVQNYQRLKNQ
jgi:hypothetical protein